MKRKIFVKVNQKKKRCLHCISSHCDILQYRMCGFTIVPRQLQNINNRCHHLARNLNDAYEKQGSVRSGLTAMFYATHPADHGKGKTDVFNCGSSLGQRVMRLTYTDLTGLVQLFGASILTF